MYRINRLNRPVLITPDEVLFHMASDDGIDERQILNNIIVAEERFIANAMCDKFYEDFVEKKNKTITAENQSATLVLLNAQNKSQNLDVLTKDDVPIGTIINAIEFVEDADYVKLWNWHLWKLVAECVDYTATIPSWLRHTNTGQQQNNPKVIGGNGSGSASGDGKDIKIKMESALSDRIDPLIERMRLWICARKSKYPLYCKDCDDCLCSDSSDDQPDGVSFKRKTDFVLGIYDNEE